MKVAIIGAGNNADYHVRFSSAYRGAQIVGVADLDQSRADRLARAYGIPRVFASAGELIRETAPDVVHVVTPPTTHLAVTSEAVDAGCHVIVEKPLALNLADARRLFELAERRGVQLCPVHNHLFDPCMRDADRVIREGSIGRIINVESYYGLNTQIPAFRDYPAPNVLPWLYRLPGGVYQDFLPHAIYPVLAYTGRPRAIHVMHRSNGILPQNLPDEIRILINGDRAFGVVTVSFASRPHLHFVRVYGTDGGLTVDINTMTTTVHRLSSLPKAAQKATYNLQDSVQKTRATASNVLRFATGRLKPYHGMMTLIHAFYDAVKTGGPPPVAKTDALDVIETIDEILGQIRYEPLQHQPVPARVERSDARRVLVTGGTGFLGAAVVRRLLSSGYAVRVLARKLARIDTLTALGAEVVWGDVGDLESFGRAFDGCDFVVHLAAGTSGAEQDCEVATQRGTTHLLELCRRSRPSHVVYISSCSVYGIANYKGNAPVTETSPLEPNPERRGAYSASKQKAEELVRAFIRTSEVPVTIIRPGAIYGPGGSLYPGMMGLAAGSTYVVFGMGGSVLPLAHVENVADGIAHCLGKPEAAGEIFNLVDPQGVTKRQYVNQVLRKADPKARVIYVPLPALYVMTWFQERLFRLLGWQPVLTQYRLVSSQKPVIFDGSKIVRALGWRPALDTSTGFEQLVAAARLPRATPTPEPASPHVRGDQPIRPTVAQASSTVRG